jgi:protein phosphatase-4 regulatory subunit 3
MLLETKIVKDDGYQKQQGQTPDNRNVSDDILTAAADTLIVWTETSGTDMALSFQEADGCAVIW